MLVTDEYYRITVDCWRMFQRFCIPQKSAAFWQELYNEANRIYALYSEKVFAKNLIFTMLDEIDRKYEKSKGGARWVS